MNSLVRFDVTEIPPGASIQEATLSLWAMRRSNENPMDISAHAISSDWDEGTATWILAREGTPWETAGGDYDPPILDSVRVTDLSQWYELHVTSAVQEWVDDPAHNYGVLLRSSNPYGIEYEFAASEHLATFVRPRMDIRYFWLPTTTATVTPTATQTSASTGTPTATDTPTVTVTATATVTPTRTPCRANLPMIAK